MKKNKQNQTDMPAGEQGEVITDGAPAKERATISRNPHYQIAKFKTEKSKVLSRMAKMKAKYEEEFNALNEKCKEIDAQLAQAETDAAATSQLSLV